MKISLKSDYIRIPWVKCVGTTQRPIERSIYPSFAITSLVLSLGGEDAEGDPGCEIAPHCRDEEGRCHCRLCCS
ncbi:hypothetical protein BT93_B3050 [Corymbia citriodora subsp. variegata]|nr:hypothetical protein BT93_B3050 [Corymbia citriodora subsp. variegata]